MSEHIRTLAATGQRPPPGTNGRPTANGTAEPDPRKQAFLARLAELRSWLDRKYAACLRPGTERKMVEDLTRLVNIVAQAERAGRTIVSAVWSANQGAPSPALPPDVWLG